MKAEPHERKAKEDINILLQVVTLAFLNSSGKVIRGPLLLGQRNTNGKLFAHAAAGRPTASYRLRAGNLVDRDSGLNISLFAVIDSARICTMHS